MDLKNVKSKRITQKKMVDAIVITCKPRSPKFIPSHDKLELLVDDEPGHQQNTQRVYYLLEVIVQEIPIERLDFLFAT